MTSGRLESNKWWLGIQPLTKTGLQEWPLSLGRGPYTHWEMAPAKATVHQGQTHGHTTEPLPPRASEAKSPPPPLGHEPPPWPSPPLSLPVPLEKRNRWARAQLRGSDFRTQSPSNTPAGGWRQGGEAGFLRHFGATRSPAEPPPPPRLGLSGGLGWDLYLRPRDALSLGWGLQRSPFVVSLPTCSTTLGLGVGTGPASTAEPGFSGETGPALPPFPGPGIGCGAGLQGPAVDARSLTWRFPVAQGGRWLVLLGGAGTELRELDGVFPSGVRNPFWILPPAQSVG